MQTLAPPRTDTTGVHLVTIGQDYGLFIQGPEARWLCARVLEFVEALHEQSAEVVARKAEKGKRR